MSISSTTCSTTCKRYRNSICLWRPQNGFLDHVSYDKQGEEIPDQILKKKEEEKRENEKKNEKFDKKRKICKREKDHERFDKLMQEI